MKTAWHQVKFDLENQSRIHTSLAQQIIERVDKPIIEFKEKQKKARKDVRPQFSLSIPPRLIMLSAPILV